MSSPAVSSGVPADVIRGAPPAFVPRLAARGRRLIGLTVQIGRAHV